MYKSGQIIPGASTEEYSSLIPEPFTFIPEDQRSIALADGSITSPFLEMFGRPPRDTGLLSERNNKLTTAQRLHLLNSSHIKQKMQRALGNPAFFQSNVYPDRVLENVYLAILSRFPTEEELRILQADFDSGNAPGPEVLIDLTWALVNSAEFLYRH